MEGSGSWRFVLLLAVALAVFTAGALGAQEAAVESPTPRLAGQRGLDWLLRSGLEWQGKHRCYGCHVQGVAAMGAALSHHNRFTVDLPKVDQLADVMTPEARHEPSAGDGHRFAGVFHAGIALAFYSRYVSPKYRDPLSSLAGFVSRKQQPDGSFVEGRVEPPIDSGRVKSTASCAITMIESDATSRNPRYTEVVRKAMAWLKSAEARTTQDLSYKILGLTWRREEADPDKGRATAAELLKLQREDGGWPEEPGMESNAYAGGMALYALKQAAVPVTQAEFVKGTLYLLKTQLSDGSWKLVNSRSGRPSNFASTMYAVIGLGGVFDPATEEEFLSLFRGRKKADLTVLSIVLYLAFPIAVIGAIVRFGRRRP